ncbi:MAG: right-handed parallel beta-helix repeat-containing protein [Bacteroidetes bacterium]|nr:right-handed parallel beta-helix repeat-containing protein [Bacteroidota bacterium]
MKKVLFLLFVIAFGASGIVSGQVAGDTYSEFGDWGMHRPYDFAEDSVLAIAVQADKKILYAGGTKKGGYYDFFVTRLFPDGKIDESFGNSGVFSYSFQQDDVIHDIAIQPDGKILLTGFSYDGQYRDLVVIRLDTDGQFDSDFEGGGMFVSSPGSMNYCGNKIVIRPNGNILIAGYRGLTSTTYLALQLLPDGSLDFSFGTGGYTYVPMGTNGVANSVALLSDGRAILAGTSDSKFGLVCLETNGSLSAGFGSGGKIIQSLGTMAECHDVVIDGAGKILTTGYSGTVSSRNLVVARFLVQGSLDNSFGGIGFKTISHGMKSEAFALALQNDGKILIGGYTNINGNNDVLVVRFKDNGDIDSTFNYDGIAEFPISYQEIAFDFAYSAGHILTAGTTTWSGMDEVFVLKFIGGAPYVAVEADDQILCSGSPLTIGLAVTGNLNSYIWKRDGNVVPGQISDTLTLGTTTIADAGLYTCEITNSEGSTVSKPVNIAIADDCGYIPPFLSLVNDTTLCGDTIIVDGIINIASTATVTICPGTHLFFRKGTSFNYDEAPDCGGIISYGRIIANGTPSDSIYFTTFSKDGYWGGIHMYGDVVHDSTGVFRYSVIENSASITSLPLCTLEAAITLQDGEKSKFEHCAIRNNETAGISTSNQNETQFLNCVIRNNGYYGYHSDNSTNADFRNTLFANQDFHANLQNESSADFTNVTFAGGQYATFGWASSPNVNLTNCIVYTNSTDPLNGEVGSINAENCLIKTDDTYELGGSANCIFNIFPEFSDTANGNYSLKACSPAMNAGTPDTTGLNLGSDDVDGNPRVFAGLNDVIDIGAYEYQGEPNLKPVAGFGKCLSQYIGASDSCFVELTNKTTDFTYEIWAKTTSYDYGQLFLHASDLGETTNALLMTSSGWVEFFAGVGGQSKGSLMSERSINDGQWHHLAVTAQGEIFTLYIDGVFEGSTTITDNISYDTFIVGNNDVGEEFIGEIDEVRVWDYARPLSEILEDMHHPISGTEPGLALYLPFDNLDGVNVPDYGPSTKIVTRVGLATLIDSDNPIVYYGKSGEDFSGSLPSYDPEADIETFSIVGSIEGMTLEPSSGNFTVFKEYQEDVQYFYQVEANGEASNVQSVIFKSTMPVAGSITQNTTWCIDSIIILQSVRVGNGVTLDICPGVEVIAEDSCGIFVDGRLLAIGTEDEPISFTCYPWNEYPNSIGWQGISFPNTPATNDTSKLIHCLIQRAYKENGYITTSGGGLFVSNTSKLIIDNSTFYANWAEGMGGGIYLNNASPIIRNSMISSNYADYGAGIAFENGSAPTILNTHITNNSANYDGGAMCVYYSSPKFIFCNISYNDYMLGTATVYNNNSTTTISSSILWENDSPVIEEYSGTVSVTYSDIQETNPGIGNINSDPLFISPPPMRGAGGALPLAKPVQGPSGADWHLSNCSPVINIGNPADVSEIDVDLDGNERVRNGLPDMGPYETYTDASIVDAPANTIACENAFVEFYVDAEGESNTYIWKKEGVVVKTSTDPWYDLYNVTTADEGWFRCVVVGACGTDSTADFSLTINPDCYYLDNGYVESDITWCYDTIYVDSQIYIMDDVTLNICPGTVLAFMSNYEIDVDGTLIAQGTEAEPIKFTVSDTTDMYFSETGGWKGLIFDNSTTGMYGAMDDNPGSVLEYCEFEFAKKGSGGLFVEKIGADTMIGISGSAINVLHFDNLLISNCTFTMNFAEGFGGALCIQDTSNIQVVGNQFLSNFAGIGGGAVCILESSPVFRNNILTDNNSDGDGGALWVSSCSSDLTNNLIANNDATQRGGGIYVVDGSGGMRLINNTLANNSAGVEASNLFLSACTPVITNTVIWSATTGSIVTASGANPDVIHCNIKGGINEFGGGFTGAYINNIDADPLFVNSGSRDYNIEIASPCVDAGTPDTSGLDLGAFDLAGNDRVIHDTIDIGAYETEFIPVSITLHPIAVDECVGNTAYFNVAAIGGTIAYQWYRNGALVPAKHQMNYRSTVLAWTTVLMFTALFLMNTKVFYQTRSHFLFHKNLLS